MARTSPPAQNARSPAPRISTARIAGSVPQATSSGSSVRYIPRVSVLSACGRLKVTTARPPRRSRRISSVIVSLSGMSYWRPSLSRAKSARHFLQGQALVAEVEINPHRAAPAAIIATGHQPSNARPQPVRAMRSTPQDILNPDAYDRAMSSAPHDDPAEIRHPLLRRLLAMWEAKCGDRMMPTRADFDVLELKDWLRNLMLIQVFDRATEIRYPPYSHR